MNRRPGDVITSGLVRLQAEQQMSETRHRNAVKAQESKIAKYYPNTIIPNWYIVRNPKEYQAHLQSISDFLITGKNTQLPHIYFLCKIGNPHPFSFHVWVLYGKLLDKIPHFSKPYEKQPWKCHFPFSTWKIKFPQWLFYFPSMLLCPETNYMISRCLFCW